MSKSDMAQVVERGELLRRQFCKRPKVRRRCRHRVPRRPAIRLHCFTSTQYSLMSIPEAIKGARAELARLPLPLDKLRRIALSIPHCHRRRAAGHPANTPLRRASIWRWTLIAPRGNARRAQPSVSVLRRCRYGAAPRNVLDAHLPAGACSDLSAAGSIAGTLHAGEAASSGGGGAPMVLFCHGGVWTTGESWQYAPWATRLAQAGIVTAVMQYTLYPQALVPAMVAEVSQGR